VESSFNEGPKRKHTYKLSIKLCPIFHPLFLIHLQMKGICKVGKFWGKMSIMWVKFIGFEGWGKKKM
jgi:hypothetical protein